MTAWYVVHTHAQAEHKARQHLERQGFEVYLPVHAKRRSHARKVETVAAPLFPRYLFVRLAPETPRWRAIQSTIGVSHLVCSGESPARLADAIVDAIRAREDTSGLVCVDLPPQFCKGQRIQLVSGTFADHFGLFQGMAAHERVMVLLSLLGRDVVVRVPAETVAAA